MMVQQPQSSPKGKRPRLISSVHPSLTEHIQQEKLKHSEYCPGPGLIPIGEYNNFYDDTSSMHDEPCPYWIHKGIIYLIIGCPSGDHEALSSNLEAEVMKCLENWEEMASQRYIFLRRGSERINGLRNYLGCSAEINKEPDASIRVLHAETKKVLPHPSLVVEVACSHETLHLAFCEAALWVNPESGVKYVILALVRDTTVELFLIGRNEPVTLSIKNRCLASTSLQRKSVRLTLREKFCVPVDASVPRSEKAKNDYYGFRILHHLVIESEDDAREESIKLDMRVLLAGSGYKVPEGEEFVQVPLLRTFGEFYAGKV